LKKEGKMRNLSIKKLFPLFAVTLFVLVIAMVGTAECKSLYLVANHHTAQFDAWAINPDGTATYQATYWLTYTTDPAGIAMDESSTTLFITSEFSGGVEMVDATTMTSLGVSIGPVDLAGIDVDDAKNIVYSVQRYPGFTATQPGLLYVYDWDPVAKALILRTGYPKTLQNCQSSFGIALDEIRDTLWVADPAAGVVRAYNVTTGLSTGNWTEDTSKSFTPSHAAIDVAVDRIRGFVYTVSLDGYCAYVPFGTGSTLLSKYDLVTGTETTVDMGHGGVGVAVDELTGYVYVTGGCSGDNLEVWDTFTSPWTQVQNTGVIGNPAGIYIPQEEVAYNPLGLSKDDGLAEGECINPGESIIYTISYDNTANAFDVHNVTLVDTLPTEVSFVSATGGGTYDAGTHTVTWNIGTLGAGTGPFSVTSVVTVNSDTPLGTIIVNYSTIDSDETPSTTVSEDTKVCEAPPLIPVYMDIKPQSCPNPLNINSQGVLPVAVLGTEDFDVSTIDLESITLAGVAPIRSSVEDVSTPIVDRQDVCDCTTEGGDGFADLTLKFDTQEIVAALGEVTDGDELVLTLTGELLDGTPIEGEDCIVVLSKGEKGKKK
jgi:uncharacterized repeat protein (TIGR01451 family)